MTPAAFDPPPVAASDELRVHDDDRVRWIAIHRPATRNGLTLELNAALIAAIEGAAAQPDLRVVVLTGEGGSFSSGLDFKSAMASTAGGGDLGDHLDRLFHGLIRAIRRCEKPVIALVDGPAAGFGCDLALACDLRVGTARTRFGEIFIKRGLMPDGGGTFHLSRLIGLGNALDMLLTGDMVEIDEARRLGLVSRVFPVETAAADTMTLARRIANGPPRVHAHIKRAVYGALDGTLENALAVERNGQLELLRSRDFVEGVSAFLEKRDPRFTGE